MWKIQQWSPDTCGCVFYQTRDAEVVPPVLTLLAVKVACAAHPMASVQNNTALWGADGRTFDVEELIAQQRLWNQWTVTQEEVALGRPRPWFTRPNGKRYQFVDGSPEPHMPDEKARDAAEGLDYAMVYGQSGGDNQAKNVGLAEVGKAAGFASGSEEWQRISWEFNGVGVARVLTVDSGGALDATQRSKALGSLDVQFGVGRVLIAR